MLTGTITKSFTFDAAHFLPRYVGKCHELHGHQWRCEVSVYGTISPDSHMIMDFKELNAILSKVIVEKFDHTLINNSGIYPTAENLGLYILAQLSQEINVSNYYVKTVRIFETPDSCFETSCSDFGEGNAQGLQPITINNILNEVIL